MILRSKRRKNHKTPDKRHSRKSRKDDSLHINPSVNIDTSFLNSSESIHSFSMEESEACGGSDLPVNQNFNILPNNSIWSNLGPRTSSEFVLGNYTLEQVRNIIGCPTNLATGITTSSTTVSTTATGTSSAYTTSPSQPVTNLTYSLPASIPNPPIISGRLSGLPTLESTTDTLLKTLIYKIDVGFRGLNESIRNPMSNVPSSSAESVNATAGPSQVVNTNQMSSNMTPLEIRTPNSNFENPPDSISRLENIVGNLASQIKDLNDKFCSLSTNSVNSQSRPNNFSSQSNSNFQGSNSFGCSYKTWPHKWRVKYDGDNQKLAVEFFFDQLASLRELNDVMWDHVITAFPVFLEGEALKWFFRYRKTEKEIRWIKLRTDMIAHFRGTDSEESILCKIASRKQEDRETFNKYYNSLLDLKDRLSSNESLSDVQMIGILKKNVKFESRKILSSVLTKSLKEFVTICQNLDEMLNPHLYREYPNYKKKVSEVEAPSLDIPENVYNIEAITNRRMNTNQNLANVKCWNCDNLGHGWQLCEEPRNIFCYWCGFKKVTCKTCPRCNQNFRLTGNNQESPPQTEH